MQIGKFSSKNVPSDATIRANYFAVGSWPLNNHEVHTTGRDPFVTSAAQ